MSPPRSLCAYVDRVWGSTTHPTLFQTGNSPRSCDDFKIGLNYVICMIALHPNSGATWYPVFVQVKVKLQCIDESD